MSSPIPALSQTAHAVERTRQLLSDGSLRTADQRASLVCDEATVFLCEVAEMPTYRKVLNVVIAFFELHDGLSREAARHLLDAQLSFEHDLYDWGLDTLKKSYQKYCGQTPSLTELAARLTNLQHICIDYGRFSHSSGKLEEVPKTYSDAVLQTFRHISSIRIGNCEDRELNLVVQLCDKTVKKLNLDGSRIPDLSPLASMPQLTALGLAGLRAMPKNIAVLSRLTNLTELSFSIEVCKIYWSKRMTAQEANELSLLETLPRLTKLSIRACSGDCQTISPYEKFLEPLKIWCLIRKIGFELLAQAGYKEEVRIATLRTMQKALLKKPESPLLRAPVNPPTPDELVKLLQGLNQKCNGALSVVLSFFEQDEITHLESNVVHKMLFSALGAQKAESRLSYTAIRTHTIGFQQLFLRAPHLFDRGFNASHFVLRHLAVNRENVKTLTCFGTDIDDDALARLLKLFSDVETLDLRNCARLTSASLKHLQTLPLVQLNIQGTKLKIPSSTANFPKLMFLRQPWQRYSQDVSIEDRNTILIDHCFQESAPFMRALFTQLSKETQKEFFDFLHLNILNENHKLDESIPLLLTVGHMLKPHLPKAWFS